MVLRRRKFLIGGVILCLALGYLAYVGFGSSATYYLTVSELKERADSIFDDTVRVSGRVATGSINWDSKDLVLEFTLADGGDSLPVIYNGVTPDAFKAGSDVVIEGRLGSEGIFKANTILTKCPSRYTPGN